MAYEFFDDVAFYFVLQALLAVFLLPPTVYYISKLISSLKPAKNVPQKQTSAQAAWVKKVEPKKGLTRHITWQRVLFVLGWALFIYLWVQLPNYQGEELASFKPYEILGLEKGADEAEIKRAFRKLSKIHHPDKNPNDPDAHQKFLLIVKAHETLTDPQAKINLEKYGNPDGYQGVSVTIGLPKWLTQKENEMKILLIYFLAMFVLPPICVYYWYKHSQQFSESGVMNASLWGFSQHIHEQMSIKYLVEVLASSVENVVIAQRPTDQKALNTLKKEVTEYMAKPKWTKDQHFWIIKSNIIWHAYLLRQEIPAPLLEDLAHLLKDSHKLLDAMLQVCLMQKYLRPTMDTITLSQMVTQAMWVDDHPLKQVPHFTDDVIKEYVKKSKKFDFQKFIEMSPDERRSSFKDIDFNNTQWHEVNSALAQFPNVDMQIKYGVEDEEGIYENDLVLLTVTLERKGQVVDTKKKTSESDEPKKEKKTKKTFEDRLDDLPLTPPKKIAKEGEAPYVFSTRFPYAKQEKWIIILIEHIQKNCDWCKTTPVQIFCPPCGKAICAKCDQDIHKREDRKAKHRDEEEEEPVGREHRRVPIPAARIAGVQKINNFSTDPQEIQIRFRPPISAKFVYEVFARCDSYIGCDKLAVFKIEVGKERHEERKEEEDGTEDDPEDVEVKEAEAKWYYLGATSFVEMIVNVIVLIVMLVFFINFLQTRGLWQKYVQPSLDRILDLWLPIWMKVYPVVRPVYDPLTGFGASVVSYVADKLTAPINATAPPFKTET